MCWNLCDAFVTVPEVLPTSAKSDRMAHAFDGHCFGELVSDAERLWAATLEQERELSSLSDLLETDASPEAAAPVAIATALEAPSRASLIATMTRLRVAAAEQRQSVEVMLARMLGGVPADFVRTRPRLLIVDDSDANRELTAAILEDAGFGVLTAANGLEGVIVAHLARPSVILMDLTMPVLNGLEAARLIRASSATQDLKVIAYTAMPDLFDGAVMTWFADVILKPASPESIVRLVRKVADADPRT